MEYLRLCPACGDKIKYPDLSKLNRAIKRNSKCSISCRGKVALGNQICSECGEEKSLSEFGHTTDRLTGIKSKCKECVRKIDREWAKNNPEKIKAKSKRMYKKYSRKPERLANAIEWERKNKAKRTEQKRIWAINNPEKHAIAQKKGRRNRRAARFAVKEHYTIKDEEITMKIFGNECFKCKSIVNISIDHHMPISLGHALTVENAVVLCMPCNMSKQARPPDKFYTKRELKIINFLFKKARKLKESSDTISLGTTAIKKIS